MTGVREVHFDIHSLLRLIAHYTDGDVPHDAEAVEAGPSSYLNGWFGILTRSRQWGPEDWRKVPYHFRYDGVHTLSFDEKGQDPKWNPDHPGTPGRGR